MRKRASLPFVLGLGLLAALVEHLIVTDSEAIEALGKEIARSCRERDWPALTDLLHEEFSYGGRDREATVAYAQRLAERHNPTDIGVGFFSILVEGDEARAQGAVSANAYGRPHQVRVDARFQRTPEGWKLRAVDGGLLGG